jgi:hypothetical protein
VFDFVSSGSAWKNPVPTVRFHYFPQTAPPPDFVRDIVEVFCRHEPAISTTELKKGLTSDEVLTVLRPDLMALGFQVEAGKSDDQKIPRPVFFGENGAPTLTYEIDAYHPGWLCGLEVEAGRAWKGNAVYRDLIQAMVMVQVNTLVLAVPNEYRYQSGGKEVVTPDYLRTVNLARALFGHSRVRFPYGLVVIGY